MYRTLYLAIYKAQIVPIESFGKLLDNAWIYEWVSMIENCVTTYENTDMNIENLLEMWLENTQKKMIGCGNIHGGLKMQVQTINISLNQKKTSLLVENFGRREIVLCHFTVVLVA